MRAFLDTNFLLDCVLPGRPEHGAAQTTKGLVDVGLIEGVVSACSLKDAYYILTKQAEPDFEDGCIRAMAERAGVDFIITRDRAAFVRSTIKTFSPAEFIRAFPIPEE